jgi:hypothetical protein
MYELGPGSSHEQDETLEAGGKVILPVPVPPPAFLPSSSSNAL